ncbi:alkene reductase [Corynebacterium lizhenjunii]|uniref:Alkene reductase n=1 Tax=Corynebacterium lizhenjunii TaxID=2709394 RepID=A0A7T0KG38_9CORY|nr:alkene reductase [Corynebacterium lizhenjunii]QPK79949.1 alkene reductase [Corynebacterium lizhenjunii]
MTELFTPLQVGRYELGNRVTMAALTRSRAGETGVPTQLHAQYYSQRASAGLVVTEGVFPAVSCRAFPGQGGIGNDAQQQGWTQVAEAVHAAGGTIFMQIMHGGRLSLPGLLEGAQPEAPSAIAPEGVSLRDFEGRKEVGIPRALEESEIPRVIESFRAAARRAIDAGIDGVEIHGANGYLLHQFLAPAANRRTDGYGGSPQARYRLVEEILRAVAGEIGADRVGLRLSPEHNIQALIENDRADVLATYGGLIDAVADMGLAYISILHADPAGELVEELSLRARANGRTKVIINRGFGEPTSFESAQELQALPYVDAVAVGRNFIANPDLTRRWQEGLELNEPDPQTFYTPGPEGYTDYPVHP